MLSRSSGDSDMGRPVYKRSDGSYTFEEDGELIGRFGGCKYFEPWPGSDQLRWVWSDRLPEDGRVAEMRTKR